MHIHSYDCINNTNSPAFVDTHIHIALKLHVYHLLIPRCIWITTKAQVLKRDLAAASASLSRPTSAACNLHEPYSAPPP